MQVKLKKVVTVTGAAELITAISVTTQSGAVVSVAGPVALGDVLFTEDSQTTPVIISAADFAAELVTE